MEVERIKKKYDEKCLKYFRDICTISGYGEADSYTRFNSIIESLFKDNMNHRVIDVGCAAGENCFKLKKYYKEVYGIDVSTECINYISETDPDINVQVMDFNHFDFPKNYFDSILMYGVLHHCESWKTAFSSIIKILDSLKVGGVLYIGDNEPMVCFEDGQVHIKESIFYGNNGRDKYLSFYKEFFIDAFSSYVSKVTYKNSFYDSTFDVIIIK